MSALTLIRHNAHRVDVDGHAMLMHVPTTSLFALDGVARDVYDLFRRTPAVDAELLRAELGAQHNPDTLGECLQSFLALDILRDSDRPDTPRPIARVEEIPLSTIDAGHLFWMLGTTELVENFSLSTCPG